MALHQVGSQGLLPDLTMLIEVSPPVAAARADARDGGAADRIGGRDAAYHARVASAFGALAEAEPQRFARIDGDGETAQVHQSVLAALAPLLASA
jgi:dTMP kinase